MLCLVNKFRAENGLKPLAFHPKLMQAAQLHSEDQAKTRSMTHQGSDGTKPSQRIEATGYKWQCVAENVAYNQDCEETVMQAWIDSPGHRANLLKNDVVHFGCGRADNGGPYWTQDFATGDGGYDTPPSEDECKGLQGAGGNKPPAGKGPPPHGEEGQEGEHPPEGHPEGGHGGKPPKGKKGHGKAPAGHGSGGGLLDEMLMLCLVNKYRQQNGAKPLKLHPMLKQSAQAHSDDQAGMCQMTHDGSDGSRCSQRIAKTGYKWKTVGENVAWNQADTPSVVVAWWNSPGHRTNMLNPDYIHAGFAVTSKENGPYWTQDFAAGDSDESQCTDQPADFTC